MNLKLNLGSNEVRIPGFLNVDIVAHKNVDIIADASALPQDDNSVDEILASHLLEHFDFHQGKKALKEWFRVLKPGGRLTIELPDLDAFCRNFVLLPEDEKPNYYVQLFGYPWEDGQSHKFGYTPYQANLSLKEAGFCNILRRQANRYTNLVDWCMKFECEKPASSSKKDRHVLCMIPTKDRYTTTLPMVVDAVINQNIKPDEIVIFDDSEKPIDLREIPEFLNMFHKMDYLGIKWSVLFGKKMGQNFSHQSSQEIAKDLIWRLDDDTVPNMDVLEILLRNMKPDVGAVAGLVVMPNAVEKECGNNPISDVRDNCQWYKWEGKKEVEHLYSSFLYRKGIVDYELSLSQACHREETIFTHRMFRKGWKLIVDGSAITTHYRNQEGGIRKYGPEMFAHDEKIFQEIQREWSGDLICYLDCGKGDHVVFKSILPSLKEKYNSVRISCCYPDLFVGEELMSIEDGKKLVTPDRFNIYKFMSDRNWKTELLDAYKRMYLEV
jgi:hypothetical protein